MYRGINEFRKVYQPRNYLMKGENGALLTDSHSTVNRWKNCFPQLLNVHSVSDVRQTEIHTAEPLAAGPSHIEIEVAIAELKRHKSSGSNQIPAAKNVFGKPSVACV
jgi:hypothetical protein